MSDWISVEERLPNGEPRLLYVECADGFEYVVGYYNRLTRAYHVNEEVYEGLCVTHWMPLPAPPSVTQKEEKP